MIKKQSKQKKLKKATIAKFETHQINQIYENAKELQEFYDLSYNNSGEMYLLNQLL